ncbi:MAG: CBS domain-containing protein [Acidimicrobiales bacterium]
MNVSEIMTANVVTASELTEIRELAALMLDHDISAVPILSSAGRLVGLVSEADLLTKEAYPEGRTRRTLSLIGDVFSGRDVQWLVRASGQIAREVMSTDPISATPDTAVATAARMMLEHRITQLPITEQGRLVGIVSRRDVLGVLLRPDIQLTIEVDHRLRSLAAELGHDVHGSVDGGVVTLVGLVRDGDHGEVIVRAIEQIDGVIDIESQISARANA